MLYVVDFIDYFILIGRGAGPIPRRTGGKEPPYGAGCASGGPDLEHSGYNMQSGLILPGDGRHGNRQRLLGNQRILLDKGIDLDGQKIEFVDVVSLTKSEIFKIELIDQITEQDTIHREAILNAVEKQIEKNFERRRMRDFEYLKGAIDPPVWLMTALLIVLIAGYGVATYFFSLKRIGRPRRY